jgi:membrane protein required for colicin V production
MVIDIAFSIIILVAVYKGFSQGLIVAVFSLLALIIGLAAALKLSVVVSHYLDPSSQAGAKWLIVLSFILTFIAISLLVNLGARIIKKTISIAMLGGLDRLGGIIFYTIIYTIIFSVFLFFAEKTGLVKPTTIAASAVYDYVSPWGPKVINNIGKIIPLFKDLFSQLQIFFENMSPTFIK